MTRDIIPAFIPPTLNGQGDVPRDVKIFVNERHPVIVANAYKLVFFKGQDLYGLDMCLELCARLKEYYWNVGLIFALPDVGDKRYFGRIKQSIANRGMEDNILFVDKPCEFYPILRQCDVFVRPTCVDDYGVSIAEAGYFGIPAVASSVCLRPPATMLFKNRDIDDFTNKVQDVLSDYAHYRDGLSGVKFVDTVGELVKVYRGLSNGLRP